jgi:hypothetical protein
MPNSRICELHLQRNVRLRIDDTRAASSFGQDLLLYPRHIGRAYELWLGVTPFKLSRPDLGISISFVLVASLRIIDFQYWTGRIAIDLALRRLSRYAAPFKRIHQAGQPQSTIVGSSCGLRSYGAQAWC